MFKAYHKQLETLHVGCENPRAYYVPYESMEKAMAGDRYGSAYYFSLNGQWDFKYYHSFEDVEENFTDCVLTDKITVPGCWQLDPGKGYDVPLYSNLWYPFPIDPPYVPLDNPCGHYSRNISLEKKPGKKYFINFEGVSSCFYLFVNKQFAGYSQVSHCTSELDITDKLTDGVNRIDVLVVKWCDGTYLEDQDMFRLSGIFRDTYILEREPQSLKDIRIKTEVSEDYGSCRIFTDDDLPEDCVFSLYDAENNLIVSSDTLDFTVNDVRLWSSENPYLYRLIIKCGNEFIPFFLALKKLEFRGNVAYFNNKPIKLLGINRHDSNPVTGYYVTVEDMKKDLFILKRANVNTIRTSHYPNSPLFMELCSKYGFMVVDEADIETHGMGFEYKDTWDWMRWSKLSTDDEWEASYVDRAQRLYERDKNFGCVIMWSLGNESGAGKNHRAMRNCIKSRDPGAFVHYENSHLEFKAVPIGENFSDISDVESRMYSSLEYTEEYAKNKSSKKPFYFCEFSCSMSTGDIHAHADLIRKYPAIFGGCFWELTDHAVEIGEGKFRYGGDFGDFPNNDVCCVDGVVFPDRQLRPGYDDLKKAYEPFECSFSDGVLTVFNRNYFETLDYGYLLVTLEVDGNETARTVLNIDNIAPQSSEKYGIDFDIPASSCAFLNVMFRNKTGTEWAEKDYEYGFNQFDVSSLACSEPEISGLPGYEDRGRYIHVNCDSVKYVFDKPYGRIISAKVNNRETLASPVGIELWRAPGYNEGGRASDCRSAAMQCAEINVKKVDINAGDTLEITCDVTVGGPAVMPVLTGKIVYSFAENGEVGVRFEGSYNKLLKEMNLRLPRFGFTLDMPAEFSDMEYFGKGPNEAYAERHRGQRYGRFTTDVDSNFVPYVKPIENGAHFGTRYAEVTDGEGTGLGFRPAGNDMLIFNATRFNPRKLEECGHNDELVPDDCVHVYLDYKMDIRGGRGRYEELEPERIWNFDDISFGVVIKPVL